MKAYVEPEEVTLMEKATSYLRDRLLIRLLFRLGCRISEALGISVGDIDFNQAAVTIEHLKTRLKLYCSQCGTRLSRTAKFCPGCGGGVEKAVAEEKEHRRRRTLPIDRDTLEMLREYIDRGGTVGANDKRLIFGLSRGRAWQIVRECAGRAGLGQLVNPETGEVRGISPHRLRDAFAVHAVKLDDSGDGLRLLNYIKASEERGAQPQIAFNSSSSYMIQGACFIEGTDSDEVVEQKKRRLRWKDYYKTLQELSPREFELLCREILKLIGARNVKLTKETRDEGIDFYGKLSVADVIKPSSAFRFRPFESFLEIWLIGQAKHYRAVKVATPDLRESIGSVNLASARTFADLDPDKYPDLRIRVADPVFMLFFTTGRISIDGWQLVKKSGIVAMDGEILAAFLADHDVAIIKEEGTKQFSRDAFFEWLKIPMAINQVK